MTKNIEGPKIPFPLKTVDGLTRRGFLAGAGGLLLLGAAGCGGGSGEETTSSGGTRTIKHKFGSTEVSGTPRRVVSVGYTDHEDVYALGVEPVGVRGWIDNRIVWPWNEDVIGGSKPEVFSDTSELNFEQVASLKPDLIVGIYSGMSRDDYETLSEIAPTIAQSDEYVDYGVPWQEQNRVIGRALGRQERSEKLVREVEGRFEEARESHPRFEESTGVVANSFGVGTYGVYISQDPRGRFMSSLGFEVPQKIKDLPGDNFSAEISQERLDLLDSADVVIWILYEGSTKKSIEAEPLYQQLSIAKEGRDIFLDEVQQAALSFSTVLSLPYTLDRLAPEISSSLDGDPETTD